MFTSFFYFLRAYGLPVSLQEWLTLCEALEKGLAGASFMRFYELCRAVLIKSEADYDRFDRAFVEFFRDIAEASEGIPDELMDWLNRPQETPGNYDEEIAQLNALLSPEEIEQMLKERLKEQDSEHNGGSYWIGTGGMSTFGNAGNSPTGIRVGGKSMHRRAFRVAGERRYRDFTRDQALDIRQFQIALRHLRQYSSRTEDPKTELNAEKTADATGENAGMLELVYERPRRNMVKVVMMMDSGGSMDYYRKLCSMLFQAVSKSNRFKDLKIYYFHNAIYQQLYTTPVCDPAKSIPTEQVLNTLDREYKLIIVGDAEMAPYELMSEHYYSCGGRSGMQWFRLVRDHFKNCVWLNPSKGTDYWYVSETYSILREEFDMYYLTVENLVKAMKKLIAAR
ncbi:MAG: VWA containing CoxE family protein [Lachnospiraceae bacterium]|nr:VWA containing CoxE family protein [Lachnospiraceae bacterium]